MLNRYEPNVEATIEFLRLLKVKVNRNTVNEALLNHPDWPSLLCISDSLNKWNLPNAAGKIDAVDIEDLPIPFIAYINHAEAPLALVSKVTGTSVTYFHKEYRQRKTESREAFIRKWNGVYLIAEAGEHSGEQNYNANRQKAFISSLMPATALVLLVITSLLLLNNLLKHGILSPAYAKTGIFLQYTISLIGVAVASLLLWYEIDKNNPLLKKVCTGIAKGNCNAVLTSKQAKVFSWLTWSEVGFFYFSSGLLTLLLAANSISIVAWLNVLALPYILFSVYYQWRVVKQWCVLCLGVQGLLVLGALNCVVFHLLFPLPDLLAATVSKTLIFYLLPPLIWFTTKPYILRLQEAKDTKREYLRVKFNTDIFETLLKKQKRITIPTDGLGVDLGNPEAKNTIIKICNPYCNPCANAHLEIEALLKIIPNLKAKIIFTTPNNEEHPSIHPTRHLMAIAANGMADETQRALDDWYNAEVKDYRVFASKYPLNGELKQQDSKIEKMYQWCKEMNIVFTPTIFANGYQLPNAYSIEDLQYFLLE